MERAREQWRELGRPLAAARCLLVRGNLLARQGDDAAGNVLEAAAAEFEEFGVPGLSARSRELIASA
jgi:hypothetical protein